MARHGNASIAGRDGLNFWLRAVAVFVGIEAAARLAIATWTMIGEGRVSGVLLLSLLQGLADDVATGLALGAPFLLGLHALAPLWRRRWARVGAHGLLYALLCVLAFEAIAELFFWNEFDSRFNSIAVNYLLFPREVIGNLRESFNLPLLLPLVFVAAAGLHLLLRHSYDRGLAGAAASRHRWPISGLAIVSFAIGVLVARAVPDESFQERGANEIAKNGLHSLVHAALTNDAQFDGLYATLAPDEALARVRRLVAQDNTRFLDADPGLGIARRVDNGATAQRLNVVLVIEESFGSVYVDGLDNRSGESTSPRLSALAEEGLFFTNIYATGNRTVRGLEALLTSFPPIPGIATTRRTGSEGMNSLPFLLKRHGYATAFLYGGRAAFDNMGHYWAMIGFDQVLQQRDIRAAGFSTIWGVADEHLFTEALARMDEITARGAPVFLSLLTVSNHRPYAYPEGRIAKDPKLKRKENAATYADWAFGDFVARARRHAWFDDTIFVFVGDHGPRVYGAAQVPVPSYRVPLVFYAPRHVPARRDDTLGSSMDMAPTLLGLLGLSYDSPFFGVDLRRVPPGGGRVAMEHNFSVALGDGRSVAMLLPGRQQRGWQMAPGPVELSPLAAPDPELARDATALFQTAHRMFYARAYHALSEGMAAVRKP